jgi:hypothetical protein
MPPRQGVAAKPWRSRTTLLLALVMAEYIGLVAWAYSGLYMDDAFIGFRYAANLLAGNGFAFNPGDRVEGITNTAWILLLAPFGEAMPLPLAAKILAAALIGLTLALLFRAARSMAARLACDSPLFAAFPVLVVVLAATQAEFAGFSMLGMETALLAAVLAGMAVCIRRPSRSWMTGGLGALAFAVHPEAVLVLPLSVAIAWSLRAMRRRDAIATSGVFALGLVAVTAARWAYFGDILPNTFHAKPFSGLGMLANLLSYGAGRSINIAFPFAGVFGLGVMIAGAIAIVRAAPRPAAVVIAATATGLLFGLYAQPDWTELARYFAPYAPLAMVLLCAGLLEIVARLARRDSRGLRVATWGAMIVAIALPGAAVTLARASDAWRTRYPGYVMTGATLVAPAHWIQAHVAAGATIATRRIGILGYYGGHRVFDYAYGLTDRDVARRVQARGRYFDTPEDPALADLWRARSPDYLLEDGPVIDRIAAAAGGTRDGFTIHGITYRVVKRFAIGADAEWTLAERVGMPNGVRSARP